MTHKEDCMQSIAAFAVSLKKWGEKKIHFDYLERAVILKTLWFGQRYMVGIRVVFCLHFTCFPKKDIFAGCKYIVILKLPRKKINILPKCNSLAFVKKTG